MFKFIKSLQFGEKYAFDPVKNLISKSINSNVTVPHEENGVYILQSSG